VSIKKHTRRQDGLVSFVLGDILEKRCHHYQRTATFRYLLFFFGFLTLFQYPNGAMPESLFMATSYLV
jgi:hypothetical protein